MDTTVIIPEVKPLAGRPKRDDPTERANLKLNSIIRQLLKNSASREGRSESAQVERLVIQDEALKRIVTDDPEFASRLLLVLNEKITVVLNELNTND